MRRLRSILRPLTTALLVLALALLPATAGALKVGGIFPGQPGCHVFLTPAPREACGTAQVTDCWGGAAVGVGESAEPANWYFYSLKYVDHTVRHEKEEWKNGTRAAAFTHWIPVEIPGYVSVARAFLFVQFESGGPWYEVAYDGKGCFG